MKSLLAINPIYFTFDFKNFKQPSENDIFNAIRQTTEQMMNPPIKNFGVEGIRKAANQIQKWEKMLDEQDLRMSIFNIYLFVAVAGTGGGIFRYMYGRFLEEASEITSKKEISKVGDSIKKCGDMWTEMASP